MLFKRELAMKVKKHRSNKRKLLKNQLNHLILQVLKILQIVRRAQRNKNKMNLKRHQSLRQLLIKKRMKLMQRN